MANDIAAGFISAFKAVGEVVQGVIALTKNKAAMMALKVVAIGLGIAFGAVAAAMAIFGAAIVVVSAAIFAIGFAIGAAIGFLINLASSVAGFFTNLWTTISTAASTAFTSSTGIGTAIVNGIIGGLSAGASAVAEKARSLARDAVKAAKEAVGFGSPAREFIKIGFASAEGFAIGIDDPLVPATVASVFDPSSMTSAFASRAGGTVNNFGGVKSSASISVSGAGDPAAVAAAVQAVLVNELAGAFEELNLEISGG